MGYITQRLYQFRGINRSLQQNGLDFSYAYDAVNVDIIGGKLTNRHIGSYRLVSAVDVPAARPIIFYRNAGNYLILRDKYIDMGTGFRASSYSVQGDVNEDGKVDFQDWQILYFHLQNPIATPLTDQQLRNADVNYDGVVDNDDVVIIRKASNYENKKEQKAYLSQFRPSWIQENVEYGAYEPDLPMAVPRSTQNVVNDTSLYIRGIGRNYVRANINNVECVIASGMLADSSGGYFSEHNFYTDGECKTAVYYLGSEATPKIHVRKFGSGLSLMWDKKILSVTADSNNVVTALKLYMNYSELTDAQKNRILLDGIYLFNAQIGATVDEDDIDNAYMWLKVTSITSDSDKVVLNVSTTRKNTDIAANTWVYVRGGCSDMPVTYMQMYYGRLFAAAHPNNAEHPRRLYWSCLSGDGRTIEDWTMSDASVDTSGGHVDIGDPSDGYITGLVVCGSQMLIFTKNRLWRLYGTTPSNYRVELVGDLEGSCISNPVEINGTVYWLSLAGIAYYNGSYITFVDDDYSTRYLLDSLPRLMKESLMYSTVHAVLFDNSIMFSFDSNAGLEDGCLVLRYELETGNVFKYIVPCDNYKQQFTDAVKDNFGMIGGDIIKYETRYFQALVHTDGTMTMTQWYDWGRQTHGWYDGKAVKSKWTSDWHDMQAPDVAKKLQDVCLRGFGRFDLVAESEINAEIIPVLMPESNAVVRDIAPHVSEGRSFRIGFESEDEFEIEMGATFKFDTGAKR